jgi:uncharacterized protein YecE (DUF72 family)
MLRFYATRFSTVEVNNSFYRMPTRTTLESWSADVPDDFSFVLKASQRITHIKRLKDVGDAVTFLVENSAALGAKLGPYLFQLPPNLRKDLPRLEEFLAQLPAGVRAAVEFRHASWFEDDVFAALAARNTALCLAEAGEEVDAPFVATADWGYLRLRKVEYAEGDLVAWKERVRAQSWNEAFVFFKHEDAGTGPKLAARFMEI